MTFKEIEKIYTEKIENIKKLSNEDKEKIYHETSNLIEYFNAMSDTAETKRTSIYNSALTRINLFLIFLTVIVTINISTGSSKLTQFFIPVYTVISISVIGELLTVFVYWIQSSSIYVSKDLRLMDYGNYWKRFYYGNPHILKISTSIRECIGKSGKNQNNVFKEEEVIEYMNGLNYEIEKFSNESLDEKVINNIQQLYLMQVHNYYKNRYNMKLATINNIFLVVKIIGAIVSIIISMIIFI